MTFRRILERWQKDEVSRQEWGQFIESPEFDRGFRVLEAHARPVIMMDETMEQTARRQAFQAGFQKCLDMLANLPDIHFKKVQEQMPEWDYVTKEGQQADDRITQLLNNDE
jgi:hypothetical protein